MMNIYIDDDYIFDAVMILYYSEDSDNKVQYWWRNKFVLL